MIRLSKVLLVATSSFAMTGIALAQDAPPTDEEGPREGAATPPDGAATPGEPGATPAAAPLTLFKGKILIAGSTLNINLSAESVGEPISLAPSVWYGVDDKLTVGLTHDSGTTPWSPRPGLRTLSIALPPPPLGPGGTATVAKGQGICLTGDDSGCSGFYDNVGVDALYSLKDAQLSLAAHPGIDVLSFDPFSLNLRLGVLGRYLVNDKISVVFDPRIGFGITERDGGNTEFLDVPVWAWYAVNPQISAYVHTGFNGFLDAFGDTLAIPLHIGGNYMVNAQLTVGLDFGFSSIDEGVDGRVLGLRAAYAL